VASPPHVQDNPFYDLPTIWSYNDNQEKINFFCTDNRFSKTNDFNIPSANIYGPLDRGMATTTLPLEVFTERNFVADYLIEVDFYSKKRKKSRFEPPFLDFGVIYALHL